MKMNSANACQRPLHATAFPTNRCFCAPVPPGNQQQGVALVIALLLLVVITLVGFAAVRGTIVQQKLASNMYDRAIAFQNTEAALRAAAQLAVSNPNLVARNCQLDAVACLANPFNDPNLPNNSVHTVAEGTGSGQYTVGDAAASAPQYVIENMGNWTNPNDNNGYNQTANSHNYGAQGNSATSVYYRITARSGDPSSAAAEMKNRAVVTLQAFIKNG